MSEKSFFRENNRAFETVVRLSSTDPESYNQEAIRDDIERYAQISSLGDIHYEAMAEIRDDLEKYSGSASQFPEAKCYGIVGQFGDGKTHFLTCLSELLREENEQVHPNDLSLLTLDPFNFPRNPVDIVRALRKRVKEVIGPDAAGLIPETDSAAEDIEELLAETVVQEKGENWKGKYEIREIEGESAGRAFAEGCTKIVKRYKYDVIVLLMDEIEKISREGNIDYQELDRYREFFDQIQIDVPVYFLVTAPSDQWTHFENIHSGAMDRMFGSQPRNHVQLQTLNEDALADTWRLRRDMYLRTDEELPPEIDHDLYPLHTSTLRAVHEIASRARSNRTAIDLMQAAYEEFLQDGDRWVPPGYVFENAARITEGDGSIFNTEQHSQICEYDSKDVLTSIAATLTQGITKSELIEVLEIGERELEENIKNLQENAWIDVLEENDGTRRYQLISDIMSQLDSDNDPDTMGDIAKIVKTEMARIDRDPDLIYRNLLRIFQENDFFEQRLHQVRENQNYLTISGNFGSYHDRRIVVTTGDVSPADIETFLADEDAELALAINQGNYDYGPHDRIIEFTAPPWDRTKTYEVEDLQYQLGDWISAYHSLESDLSKGGNQLLNLICEWAYQEVISLDEFDLMDQIQEQFERLYPTYPGPINRMNSSAIRAYEEALSRGNVQGTITLEDVRDYGYATSDQALTNYFEEWEQYNLAEIDWSANPIEATIQISATEKLILERIEGGELTRPVDVYEALVEHGYERNDVEQFIDILKQREKIRETDDRELVATTENLTIAKKFYDVVTTVADWLTDDRYPQEFQKQYVPTRDELVAQRGTCEDRYEMLGTEEFKTEGINLVATFIREVVELRDLCVQTIRDFENTQIAQTAMEVEGKINDLRKVAVDDTPPSNQFTILADNLGSTGARLANAARRKFDDSFKRQNGSIFEALQSLSDEFINKLAKTGPYGEYNTESEMRQIEKQFREVRPEAAELATALEVIETFDEQISLAREIARSANQIMKNLLTIEEFNASQYQTTGSTEIEEASQAVANKFLSAITTNEQVGESITDLSFTDIKPNTVDSIQQEVADANAALQKAQTKKEEIDDRIYSETKNIHREVSQYTEQLSTIIQVRQSVIQEMFSPKSVETDIVERATIWWKKLESEANTIEQLGNQIQQEFPDTATDLVKLRETFDDFKHQQKSIGDLCDQLVTIHEKYFNAVRDELPPAEAEVLEKTISADPTGETLDQIQALLDRIEQINDRRGIELLPLRQRICDYVGQHKTVNPVDLAMEIPDDRFHESEHEVIRKLTDLIQERELTLRYKGSQVLVTTT